MSTTILGYWGIRGIVQPLKFLLEFLEVKYEDKKYQSSEQWAADKEVFLKTNALANLPYLTHDNTTIFESTAIAAYLIEKTGHQELLGTTLTEKVAIAQARGVFVDLQNKYFGVFFGPKDDFETKGKELVKTAVSPYLKKLEFLLQGNKFVTGNNVSIADFFLFEAFETVNTFDASILADYPNIVQQHTNFIAIPQIEAYLASDRFQARPFLSDSNWG